VAKGNEAIKEHVRKSYSKVAKRAQSSECSCSCCGSDAHAGSIGYDLSELKDLPESAVQACAGCGNPTAIAGLRKGEVVLDLGSGGGIDVLLAAKKVGPKGRAIGVDMTQGMIDLARKNADDAGFENVEFRLGDIEDLPVDSGSVDVIISNCVINLAPDKDRVFKEAYRVLRAGGRVMVSDIVTKGELPKEIREDPDAWAGCVAGALDEAIYIEKLRSAGFKDVKVLSKTDFMDIVSSAQIEAHKP
jgi:ubiquinone/menaquinone biosynthesis C-methylase UbiE